MKPQRVFSPQDLKPVGGDNRDPVFSWPKTLPGWPLVDEQACPTSEAAMERAQEVVNGRRGSYPGVTYTTILGVLKKDDGRFYAVTQSYASGS